MKKLFVVATLLTLLALPALAGGPHGASCAGAMAGVQRTATNIDNGIRVTMSATDPKVVEKLQAMTGKDEACCPECPMHAQGVTRSVEKTADGIVITATATDPELVKKLQSHGATLASAKGCCRGKAAHSCPHDKGEAPAKS